MIQYGVLGWIESGVGVCFFVVVVGRMCIWVDIWWWCDLYGWYWRVRRINWIGSGTVWFMYVENVR